MRFRPGTDVALIWGILWHIFENGWEDKKSSSATASGAWTRSSKEVAKWNPEEVERVTGVPGSSAECAAWPAPWLNNKSWYGDLVHGRNPAHQWQQQHPCILCASAGAGQHGPDSGGGTNIFRGHDNVQGATDFCVLSHTLPGYYGLKTGSWMHWARVWDVDIRLRILKGRFAY